MKMEQTECSETSAYKIQTPGNYPKESVQHFTMSLLFGFSLFANSQKRPVKNSDSKPSNFRYKSLNTVPVCLSWHREGEGLQQ